jgi:O-antigen/teichoic acid export membrane protein
VEQLKEVLRFGGYALANNLISTLIQQADVFIGGRRLTPLDLAHFSVPRELCLRVGMAINPIATRVSMPLMARAQEADGELARMYTVGLNAANSLSFPIYFFIAAHPAAVSDLIFGAQWTGETITLQLLAAWGLFRSITNPTGTLLYATGRIRRACAWNVSSLVVIVPIIYCTTPLGASGLAVGVLSFVTCTAFASWAFIVRPVAQVPFPAYLASLYKPALCSLAAAVTSIALTTAIEESSLALAIAGFAFAYIATTKTLNEDAWRCIAANQASKRIKTHTKNEVQDV